MADSPDHQVWVEIAEGDFRAAHVLATADLAAFGQHAAFHCQQCAEKYLKACLRFHGMDFPKIHDFQKLLRICERLSPEFRSLSVATGRLQPFAVQVRYSLRPVQPATVRQALEDTAAVRGFCRQFMGIIENAGDLGRTGDE